MKVREFASVVMLCAIGPAAAHAAERERGWDVGADLLYQDSQDITFDGGSTASLDDDIGVALTFGYRFNSHFELTFGLDWNTVGYDVNVAPAVDGGLGFTGHGQLEAFTPRVDMNFNLLNGNLTPYLSGGVGWSYIDTNIPDGPPQSSCWWDPWLGHVCGTWQSTQSIDELTYNLGVGVRWDVGPSISLRFAYDKHWLDLGEATTTPALDQFKLGVSVRY
jgi:opacity protein-like surface antigen